MVQPNFFIVGAPKCGTTALSAYLRSHPEIFLCWPKEPLFFCSDFPRLSEVRSRAEYLDLFSKAPEEAVAVGEASALYLYSDHALAAIREFDPRAKLIAMLRNPVDLAHAYHSQLLYALSEDVPDFERAWDLQDARRAGASIPERCLEPALLQYRSVAMLGAQVERLLSLFPRDQVKLILFDDFKDSSASVYADVLGFLGVEHDGRSEFPLVNENAEHRSELLSRVTQRPPQGLMKLARAIKRMLGLSRLGVLDVLRNANARTTRRRALSPELRSRIAAGFSDDIRLLELLIHRDLGHWLGPGPE
jgi:hypothetical protein